MGSLQIGTAKALLSPDEIEYTKDNRRELVKTLSYSAGAWIPGVVILDNGVCAAGLIARYSGVKFKTADWQAVEALADSLATCSVVDPDGTSQTGCRVFVASYKKTKKFPGIITVDIEIWRA